MANSIITDKLRESRHNTNIGGINITSLNIGRKRPIFCREVKPGDKGTLSISGNYILNPLVATNVGKVHVKTEAYFVPACDNMVGFEDMLLGKPVYKNGVAVNPHVPRCNAYNWVNQFFLNCNYNTSLRCYDLPSDWDDSTFLTAPSSLVNVDVQEQLNALGTRDFDKNSSAYFKNDSYSSVNPTNEIIGYIPFNLATRLLRGVISYDDLLSKYSANFFVPFWSFYDDDTQSLHFTSLRNVVELNVPYSSVYDYCALHMSGRHGEEFMLLDDFQQKSYMMTFDNDSSLDSFYVPIVRLTQYGKDVLNLTNAFKWIQTYNPMYMFNSIDSIHSSIVTSYQNGSFEPNTRVATLAGTCCLFSDVFGFSVRLALSDSSTRSWMLNNVCKRAELYAQGFDYFIGESVPSAIANICVNNTSVYFLDINAFVDSICSSSPLNQSFSPISDAKLLFNLPDVEWRRYADVYEYNFEGLCGKLLFDFTYVVSLLPIAAHCSLFYTHTLPKVWKNLFYRLYSMLSHDGTYDDAVYFHLLQVLLPLSFITRYDDNFLSEVWATPTSPDGEVVRNELSDTNGVLHFASSSNGINSDFPAYGVNNAISSDNSSFREQLSTSVSEFLGISRLDIANFDKGAFGNNPVSVGESFASAFSPSNNPNSFADNASLLALKLARHLRSFALKNNVNSFSKIAALCERFGLRYQTHDLFESSLIYSNETEIEVQKIASTTETNQISLGDIAGHGESYDNGKKVSFRTDRFGYVIVYLSVTPVGVLYEGRNKEMSHIDMLDFYAPQTDALTMTPVSSSEVRARYDDAYMPVKLGSSVFGFAPYGYEYKIGNNVLSGDFLIRSAGKYTQDSYHLLRTLGAGASFNGNGTFSPTGNNPFNYSYLVQNPFFNLSFDAQQFNRIFQSTDSLLDKIYFFGRVDFNLSRQGRPLFDLSLDENATESIN